MKIEFFSEKVKSLKFSIESEKFFRNRGRNLKQGGKTSFPQGGWTSLLLVTTVYKTVHKRPTLFIHSFIHSGYFYSASSRRLLLRGAFDTARILHRSFTPKRHRQLRAKDLHKVPTWRLERE